MGVLTLLQIRTELDSSMGSRSNVDDTRRDVWINLAYTDIASGIDFTELDDDLAIPTVQGQNNYAAPADSLIVQMFRDEDNDNLLTWIPNSEYFRLDRTQTPEAAPARWTRRGDELLVFPNPNGVINLLAMFKQTPPPLVGDGAVTILPPYVDNGVLLLGIAYGLLAVGEDARATTWANRAVSYLGSRLTGQDFSFLLGGLTQTQPTASDPVEGSASGT
jgi:hypothetical protein